MPPLSPDDLCEKIGYRFEDMGHLELALIHPSLNRKVTKKPKIDNNERLEFLGDRVLGLIVAEMVYKTYPQDEEGSLAKRHAALVRKETLARVARNIELGQAIDMVSAEERSGGRENEAILANACEAVIAALYLDGGLKAAQDFILSHWTELMAEDITPPQDAKTALQEWAQAKGLDLPLYDIIARTGPDHAPTFEIEVQVSGFKPARALGTAKRKAEQAAAQLFLDQQKGTAK